MLGCPCRDSMKSNRMLQGVCAHAQQLAHTQMLIAGSTRRQGKAIDTSQFGAEAGLNPCCIALCWRNLDMPRPTKEAKPTPRQKWVSCGEDARACLPII